VTILLSLSLMTLGACSTPRPEVVVRTVTVFEPLPAALTADVPYVSRAIAVTADLVSDRNACHAALGQARAQLEGIRARERVRAAAAAADAAKAAVGTP